MAHVIAYLRWSTDEQDLSEDTQSATIDAWATAQGLEVGAWYVDAGVSGATSLEKRDGLREALGALEAGSVLVVAKRDRLSRDVITSAVAHKMAARARASIVSADGLGNGDSPEEVMFRTLLDAFAQYERALIASRTRAALQAKKARGEAAGGTPPFGWCRRGNRWVEDPTEQRAREMILRLAADGLKRVEIVEEVHAAGFRNRKGGTISGTQVRRILALTPPAPAH